jgi:hypothetical protein
MKRFQVGWKVVEFSHGQDNWVVVGMGREMMLATDRARINEARVAMRLSRTTQFQPAPNQVVLRYIQELP